MSIRKPPAKAEATGVAKLRETALNFNSSRRFEYPVCLNPDKKQTLDAATTRLQSLAQIRTQMQRAQHAQDMPTGRRSIADPDQFATLDASIAQAEQAVIDAEQAIGDDELIIVQFADRLTEKGKTYRELEDAYTDPEGVTDWPGFWLALLHADYLGCVTRGGEPVPMKWAEIKRGLLNEGDIDICAVGVSKLHREAGLIPFVLNSSGQPGTTSEPA